MRGAKGRYWGGGGGQEKHARMETEFREPWENVRGLENLRSMPHIFQIHFLSRNVKVYRRYISGYTVSKI